MANASNKTALLVMDVQGDIVDRLEKKDEYLKSVRAAVDSAHSKQVFVIHIVVGFRPGFPEVSSNNKSFGAIKESARTGLIDPRPVIAPIEGDVVITKRRVSAFSGSDLEVVLRAQSIQHLVLTGIATSGVVLSTLREAADKDYQLSVLSDLCADFDEAVHSVLIEKVFPRQANVITSKQWVRELEHANTK
ncbi:MAG TPA: isochorismatase family cysteine hydrolase [Candidatus Saccharimonadales bacterium]|jgi:nicotinamidase-related amidase|nr:isochorismatase family cysteine hydrolase [Candidatus Saccharimonadales bacterium]